MKINNYTRELNYNITNRLYYKTYHNKSINVTNRHLYQIYKKQMI